MSLVVVQLGADKMTNVMLPIAGAIGRHIARWPRLAIALVAAGSISAAPLRAAERYDADPALVAAAKKEGEIVWYTTLIVDQIVRPLIRAFRSQVAAIDIKYIRADSLALAVKLINEGRAGRIEADIWHLTDGMRALVEAGVVAEFDLPGAKGLAATVVDPGKRWVATNLSRRSLAYNTHIISEAQAPRSFQDLLDPRWKGKFAWNPNSMAGAWGFIGTVLTSQGEDKGMAYLRELAKQNITPVPVAARAVLDRVIAGEYPMGLEMTSTHVAISAARGAPVRWVAIEPVSETLQVGGITKGAPHPNAAKLFLDFMVSPAGQKVFRDAVYLPVRQEVRQDIPASSGELKPNAVVFSPEDVDANSRRWAKIYDELFR
jgi:iron(III) transport system substrate-binding protein